MFFVLCVIEVGKMILSRFGLKGVMCNWVYVLLLFVEVGIKVFMDEIGLVVCIFKCDNKV